MIPYRELEHTADVGLEIYGSTIEELFINSIKGLFHLISPELEKKISILSSPFSKKKRLPVIELSALTQAELLIHWLNEFIYNFFVKNTFPKVIMIDSLTARDLMAKIEFSKYDESLKINLEIKAATYHNILIKKIEGKYSARVIFDV